MRIPQSHSSPTELAMTPLIDVVFLLMIFFVCTAGFETPEESLPSTLLTSGSGASSTPVEIEPDLEQIVVRLDPAPGGVAWQVNDRPLGSLVEVRDMLAAIAKIDPSLPVVLDVERTVRLGNAIDVYDLCRVVGFAKVQFAASVDP